MASRLSNEDRTALLRIRENLIIDHDRILDGNAAPASALCKQADVAAIISKAVRSLEEVLSEAGGVEFRKG